MYGFSLGVSVAHAGSRSPLTGPIVAWGDSLTAQGYPAIAGTLFAPARSPANKGLGGQGSYSIAVRQGGQPLTVSLAGNQIPARQNFEQAWSFTSNAEGWFAQVEWEAAGRLKVVTTNFIQGAQFTLPTPIVGGRAFTLEFDIEMPPGMTVRVSGLKGGTWAANDGLGGNGVNITASGHYVANLVAGNAGFNNTQVEQICFLTVNGGAAGTWYLDNVKLTIPPVQSDYAVAVTAKNNNILTNGGSFTGTASGTVAGVHGSLSTDASGNWTFTRDTAGAAVTCPANAPFVLNEPALFRDQTAWIWAGNNGVYTAADAAATKADIAAMIAYLGHTRFLVLSVLASTSADAARVAVLQQLNRDLASLYGHRFVDVYTALQSAGNGSGEDNADIAAGYTPRSLRVDNIHLTPAGSTIVAQKVWERMQREGW